MLAIDGVLYFAAAVCFSLWPEGKGRELFERMRGASAGVVVVSTGGGRPFESADESVVAERTRASSADGAAILIQGLVKDYSAVSSGKAVAKRAINDLYLSIQRGEVFGLLGPNGAGKTTTLQVLTGLTSPSSGSAFVCGFDISTHMKNVKRVIGVCPQFDILWEDMSVRRKYTRNHSWVNQVPERLGYISWTNQAPESLGYIYWFIKRWNVWGLPLGSIKRWNAWGYILTDCL